MDEQSKRAKVLRQVYCNVCLEGKVRAIRRLVALLLRYATCLGLNLRGSGLFKGRTPFCETLPMVLGFPIYGFVGTECPVWRSAGGGVPRLTKEKNKRCIVYKRETPKS